MIKVQSSDEEIISFLSNVKDSAPRDAGLAADLAAVLAGSGRTFKPRSETTADVASTGGPSSLSTLLCPLYLRTGAFEVPKLGVPGRPAGGIDCLAQLDGYQTAFDDAGLHRVLGEAGYAHFLAAHAYAPLDARLFSLRQKHGFQEVPTLVAASLLSKKLAVGVQRAGLDVRVAPHGNFGRTWGDAQDNARLFTEAAELLGLMGCPVLTDGAQPYQPYIGRAEALVALADVFDSTEGPWLTEHLNDCRGLSVATASSESRSLIENASRSDLRQWFYANVLAQGSSCGAFEALVGRTRDAHKAKVAAQQDGFVSISLEGIRRTLVTAQAAANPEHVGFPDPAGVVLMRKPGERVSRGDVLATVRCEKAPWHEFVMTSLASSISATDRAANNGETTT
jgi:thymidine phosphorylase